MTRASERRAQRLRGPTNELLCESRFVIRCLEPEKMPALIDLLIAQGSLSEADRPHCIHWTTLKSARELSREGISKTVDAEDMLKEAGIRSLMAEGWDVFLQGRDAFNAFCLERFGCEPDAEVRQILDEVEQKEQKLRSRECAAAGAAHPEACISTCK